jgi:hypothetical protein
VLIIDHCQAFGSNNVVLYSSMNCWIFFLRLSRRRCYCQQNISSSVSGGFEGHGPWHTFSGGAVTCTDNVSSVSQCYGAELCNAHPKDLPY